MLTAEGVLNADSYLGLRDDILTTALAHRPRAIIIDVTNLEVPAPTAWAVFTSARWQLARWPATPIVLACGTGAARESLARTNIGQHIAIYGSTGGAIDILRGHPRPQAARRASAVLPACDSSAIQARQLMTRWLTDWSQTHLISQANTVATVLVDNVLHHTDSPAGLSAETTNTGTMVLAVSDNSHVLPARHEDTERGPHPVSGLAIVSCLAQAWGAIPTTCGKTVWARLGAPFPRATFLPHRRNT